MNNCKIEAFLMKIRVLKRKLAPGTSRHQDFLGFSILRYVGVFCHSCFMIGVYFLSFSFILVESIVVYLKLGSRLTYFCVLCRFCYDLGLFSDIFLHFLQKYRCVPKIGFPADILMDISIFVLFSSEVSLCS